MTISATTTRDEYTGNGATLTFVYSNKIFQNSELVVYSDNVLQTLDTDYTVAGAGVTTGGSITYTTAPASNVEVVIVRNVAQTQSLDFVANDPFSSSSLEDQLDRQVIIVQQLQDAQDRTIIFPEGEQIPVQALAAVATRGGKVLGFDGDGNIEYVTLSADKTVTASVFAATLLDDLTAAAARVTIGAGIEVWNRLSPWTDSHSPTANLSILTNAAFRTQQNTVQATKREFMVSLGMLCATGSGGSGGTEDKVALYVGVDAASGCGDVWAINTVTEMSASSGTYNAQGYEIDLNNLNAELGSADGAGGLSAPVSYVLNLSGAGTLDNTAAMLISGPGGNTIYNRGIVIANQCIDQSTIQDFSNSDRCLDIRGTPTHGIYQVATSTTVNYFGGFVGIGKITPIKKFEVEESSATLGMVDVHATSASYTGNGLQVRTATVSGTGFNYIKCVADTGGTPENDFIVRGDGATFGDGAYSSPAADYAEMFEWADGNPTDEDRRGWSVALLPNSSKVKRAMLADDPIGIVSARPAVVGRSGWNRWQGKYVRDGFGREVHEDVEVVFWEEIIPAVVVEMDVKDTDGNKIKRLVTQEQARRIQHSYEHDKIPDGLTAPPTAQRVMSKRRRLNPDFDDAQIYVPRSERKEWDAIGLMGCIQMVEGEKMNNAWRELGPAVDGVVEVFVR